MSNPVILMGEHEQIDENKPLAQIRYCPLCDKKTEHHIYNILISKCLKCDELFFQHPLP